MPAVSSAFGYNALPWATFQSLDLSHRRKDWDDVKWLHALGGVTTRSLERRGRVCVCWCGRLSPWTCPFTEKPGSQQRVSAFMWKKFLNSEKHFSFSNVKSSEVGLCGAVDSLPQSPPAGWQQRGHHTWLRGPGWAVLPSGTTGQLQPFDVATSKPFKDHPRKGHESSWCLKALFDAW